MDLQYSEKQQARGAHRDHQGLHRGTRRQRVAVRILVSQRVLTGFFLLLLPLPLRERVGVRGVLACVIALRGQFPG